MNDSLFKAKKISLGSYTVLLVSVVMMFFIISCTSSNIMGQDRSSKSRNPYIPDGKETGITAEINPEPEESKKYGKHIAADGADTGQQAGQQTTQQAAQQTTQQDAQQAAHIEEVEPAISSESRLVYVLQDAGLYELFAADFDVAVVDPDDSGMEKIELETLKRQDKKIIAYLSIGEAEDYRHYWKDDWKPGNPEFLDEENAMWKGNYRVKYWMEQWQQIVFSRIHEIMDKGYNGVYLDMVDVYSQYQGEGIDSAKDEMVEFVVEISRLAKSRSEDFLIIPQNAEELTSDTAYLGAIDGTGKESLWFSGEKRVEKTSTDSSLFYLSRLADNKKFVFVISYVEKKANREEFLDLARTHGFIPYIGRLELDTIEDINNTDS